MTGAGPQQPYEVFALRYARHNRERSDNFIGADPHDGPMPLDYPAPPSELDGICVRLDVTPKNRNADESGPRKEV